MECSSYVQTGRAICSCKLLMQPSMSACGELVECSSYMQLVMQTAHANCSCSSPRALVESCTSAHGELHERSWSSPSVFFTLGLGTWGWVGPRVGGMWQGLGVCGRVWGHVAGCGACGRGSGLVHGRRHAAGAVTCGRLWRHVAGCGDMWHGWWQGVGACGRGLDM